jgi:hypothetical protein
MSDAWEVEVTNQFTAWWDALTLEERESLAAVIVLLQQNGPTLPFPYSSGVQTSRHSHMREFRTQHRGRPYRILYAFDPRRVAILLVGGDKTGDNRWYDRLVPLADRLYDAHLEEISNEA